MYVCEVERLPFLDLRIYFRHSLRFVKRMFCLQQHNIYFLLSLAVQWRCFALNGKKKYVDDVRI